MVHAKITLFYHKVEISTLFEHLLRFIPRTHLDLTIRDTQNSFLVCSMFHNLVNKPAD